MPFQVKITAINGMLPGGVQVHRSSPFIKYANADSWAATYVQANKEAGRDYTIKIIPIMCSRHNCADLK